MKEDIIEHRISKSKESLNDALLLIENQRFLSIANRLYYAAFYIVSAYFAQENILVRSHKGMSAKIKDELVAKDLLRNEDLNLYGKLMKAREESDYGDFIVISENEAKKLYSETKIFIQKIELLITPNE